MEIGVQPMGSASDALASELRQRWIAVVERSGLPYHIGVRILIQGSVGELFALAERLHGTAREVDGAPGVRTDIHIEDGGAVERLLDGRVEVLQAAV